MNPLLIRVHIPFGFAKTHFPGFNTLLLAPLFFLGFDSDLADAGDFGRGRLGVVKGGAGFFPCGGEHGGLRASEASVGFEAAAEGWWERHRGGGVAWVAVGAED